MRSVRQSKSKLSDRTQQESFLKQILFFQKGDSTHKRNSWYKTGVSCSVSSSVLLVIFISLQNLRQSNICTPSNYTIVLKTKLSLNSFTRRSFRKLRLDLWSVGLCWTHPCKMHEYACSIKGSQRIRGAKDHTIAPRRAAISLASPLFRDLQQTAHDTQERV